MMGCFAVSEGVKFYSVTMALWEDSPAFVRLVPATEMTFVPKITSRRSLTSGVNPAGVWAAARPASITPDMSDCSNISDFGA